MGMLGRSLYRGAVHVSHSAKLESGVQAVKGLRGAAIGRQPTCIVCYCLCFPAVA